MRTFASLRRRRGVSLVEMTVAASILATVLALTFPALKTIGDAGDDGRAQSWTQADNRQALLRIARDVMNGSVTAADDLGNLRFEILEGNARESITGNLGFTSEITNVSQVNTTAASGSYGSTTNYYSGATGRAATGSGARGGTRIGRDRSATGTAAEYDAGAFRPRERYFANNSVLRFQKILNYTWGADGEPVINWGNWVEYRVVGRRLVRIENGNTLVVSPNTSGFAVERTAANTLLITLVTERRSVDGTRPAVQANHIEVLPKN